jgi:hypothetical protein
MKAMVIPLGASTRAVGDGGPPDQANSRRAVDRGELCPRSSAQWPLRVAGGRRAAPTLLRGPDASLLWRSGAALRQVALIAAHWLRSDPEAPAENVPEP